MNPWLHRWRQCFRGSCGSSRQQHRYRPVLECLQERCLLSGGYTQVNLASDVPGLARLTDPNLINPWGISFSPTGPFWFADNGSGVADLLDGRGQPVPLVVLVPPTSPSAGTPTDTVFNGGPGFRISENGVTAPSRFLFATEDGTISGWSEIVDLSHAILAVDNSSSGAVYKGLALAADPVGQSYLYAADFGRGTIDVFDQDFKPVVHPDSFEDPGLPNGYAPFNIQNLNNLLFVTYAQRDQAGRDDVAGAGHGFIDVYDTSGNLLRRFASQGPLNSPWGLALAPASFGPFGGALLVGNNGDGLINAYDPRSGAFLGTLTDDNGTPITILSLWALSLGNDHEGGASDTLFFTAGLDHEAHGLFGAIQAPQRRGADTAGLGAFDPHALGEPGDYPLPPSRGPTLPEGNDASGVPVAVLLPLTDSSLALIPTLSTTPQLRVQIEAPAVANVVSAVSFQEYAKTPGPLSNTAFFSPSAVDLPLRTKTKDIFLSLNILFDLSTAQACSENPVLPVPRVTLGTRETNQAIVATRRWSSARGFARADGPLVGPYLEDLKAGVNLEQGLELPPSVGQANKALAQIPSEGRLPSADERTAKNKGLENHDRSSWTKLLSSLLVVVGIPLVSALCRRPKARSLNLGSRRARTIAPLTWVCPSRKRKRRTMQPSLTLPARKPLAPRGS